MFVPERDQEIFVCVLNFIYDNSNLFISVSGPLMSPIPLIEKARTTSLVHTRVVGAPWQKFLTGVWWGDRARAGAEVWVAARGQQWIGRGILGSGPGPPG